MITYQGISLCKKENNKANILYWLFIEQLLFTSKIEVLNSFEIHINKNSLLTQHPFQFFSLVLIKKKKKQPFLNFSQRAETVDIWFKRSALLSQTDSPFCLDSQSDSPLCDLPQTGDRFREKMADFFQQTCNNLVATVIDFNSH